MQQTIFKSSPLFLFLMIYHIIFIVMNRTINKGDEKHDK